MKPPKIEKRVRHEFLDTCGPPAYFFFFSGEMDDDSVHRRIFGFLFRRERRDRAHWVRGSDDQNTTENEHHIDGMMNERADIFCAKKELSGRCMRLEIFSPEFKIKSFTRAFKNQLDRLTEFPQ